jgi:hypothetical protein
VASGATPTADGRRYVVAAGACRVRRPLQPEHRTRCSTSGLLHSASSPWPTAAGFLFSIGFFAMLFVNVQYLTGVWGYTSSAPALASRPGPLRAVCAGPPGGLGRPATAPGRRRPGAVLFAAGILFYVLRSSSPSPTTGASSPRQPRSPGIGIGFTISTLGSASSAFLPPTRFAMGSAFNATARQIGAALGIAMVVAVLGTPSPAEAPAAFDRAWSVLAGFGLASGLLMLSLFRPPVRRADTAVGEGPLAGAPAA